MFIFTLYTYIYSHVCKSGLTNKKQFFHPSRCARSCPVGCNTRSWWRLPSILLAPVRGSRQSCTWRSSPHRTVFPNGTGLQFPTKIARAVPRIFGAFPDTVPWTGRELFRTSRNTASKRFSTLFHFCSYTNMNSRLKWKRQLKHDFSIEIFKRLRWKKKHQKQRCRRV